MRVLLVLIAVCSVASAKPAADGAAVVVVIDRSLGDLGAVAKVVGETARGLGDDRLGVVAYARTARVVVPLQATRAQVPKLLAAIKPEDGANVVAGLEAAFQMLKGTTTRHRRVIVVT
ncbi:MAG TPA: VWA domain-containing protein, partial [Xanthomonadales bacterium]|nr:VWA domain-containing protein [Xanthomonadales bacterium]